MKVLLYDATLAFLTPGGKTTHVLKLQQEISKLGIDIQFARWWDGTQGDADIIHFFHPDEYVAKLAKSKGISTYFSMLFDYESNKSEKQKRIKLLKNSVEEFLSKYMKVNSYWHALPYMDKVQFMHKYDRMNALRYFPKYLDVKKTLIIPHAYDPSDMNISENLNIKEMNLPAKYLISVANISERKQTVILARYAKEAQVPIVFLGSKIEGDPYYQTFKKEIDNMYVFYPGFVSKEWKDCLLQHASGYALLSWGESGCIAVYEAAAYKLPLLLSNLPWAWGYEEPTDIHFCDQNKPEIAIQQLKQFYETSGKLDHTPFVVRTWADVAKMYVEQYREILNSK